MPEADAPSQVNSRANFKTISGFTYPSKPGRREEAGLDDKSVLGGPGWTCLALPSVLRDGLLRRSEAAVLTWADIEFRANGTALITVRRSNTEPEVKAVTLYIGKQAYEAIKSADELLDRKTPDFRPSPRQIGRREQAAAAAAGTGEGFHRPQWPRGWSFQH